MPNKTLPSVSPLTRKKYMPAFKVECVRQVAAGAQQTRSSPCSGSHPRLARPLAASAEVIPSSAERNENKRLRAELKRVEQERDILKKVVTNSCF